MQRPWDVKSAMVNLVLLATEELFQQALTADDYDRRADAVYVLQERGTPDVFAHAAALLTSREVGDRRLVAWVLSQNLTFEKNWRNDAAPLIEQTLQTETAPCVIEALVTAAGHSEAVQCLRRLRELSGHPDRDIRLAVAQACGHLHDPCAVDIVIGLSTDSDEEIRDWATFVLGSLLDEYDTPAVRRALGARLHDVGNIRSEALVGLALRGDQRAESELVRRLECGDVDDLTLEAAESVGSPRLIPYLLKYRGDIEVDKERLRAALAACGSSLRQD